MSDGSDKITLVTLEEVGGLRSRSRAELITEEVSVALLRDNFQSFMANLQSMIDVELDKEFPFELQEIQFSAEISANGAFKLLGTGVGIEASSSVTFILQRRSKPAAP